MKQLLVIAVILIAIVLYVVTGAESVSKAIENYTDKNIKQEEQKEKILFFNASYCSFVGKYKRSFELIDKFIDTYDNSNMLDMVYYLRAKTLDASMDIRATKEAYKEFLDKYPDSKYAEKVKNRLNELKTFY